MPARKPLVGSPIWNDLTTGDLDAAVEFYTALFGWAYASYGDDFGNYGAFSSGGKAVAGIGTQMSDDDPIMWNVYLQTLDTQATVEAATAAGAEVLAPAMEVPGMGMMAVIVDPSGASVGLWEPRGMNGFETNDEVAAPVWHELFTKDFRKAAGFYRDILGWQTETQSDTDEFRYLVQVGDGGPCAGVMDAAGILAPEVPSVWRVYFGVADADEFVKKAVGIGGQVIQEPQDSPFGRMAVLADPQGANFNVISVQDQ